MVFLSNNLWKIQLQPRHILLGEFRHNLRVISTKKSSDLHVKYSTDSWEGLRSCCFFSQWNMWNRMFMIINYSQVIFSKYNILCLGPLMEALNTCTCPTHTHKLVKHPLPLSNPLTYQPTKQLFLQLHTPIDFTGCLRSQERIIIETTKTYFSKGLFKECKNDLDQNP